MAQRYLIMGENCLAFNHRRLETGKMDLLQRQIITRSISMVKYHTGIA